MQWWGIGLLGIASAVAAVAISCERVDRDAETGPQAAHVAAAPGAPGHVDEDVDGDGGVEGAPRGDGGDALALLREMTGSGAPETFCRTARVIVPGGQPIADAMVLSGEVGGSISEQRTDADGEVEVCFPLQARISLEAFDDDGRWHRASGPWRRDDTPIVLVPMAAPELSVRATDPEGRPVEGARVYANGGRHPELERDALEEANLAYTGVGPARTDADGRAVVRTGRVGIFRLVVDHDGYLPSVSGELYGRPGEHASVDVTLRPGVRVCGELWLEGRPTRGWVELSGRSAPVGGDGRFCFDERLEPGAQRRLVYGAEGAVEGRRVVVADGTPLRLELERAGTIEVVTTVDRAIADCIGWGSMSLENDHAIRRGETWFGEPSPLRGVAPGEYTLHVQGVGLSLERRVTVRAGVTTEARVELRLPPGHGLVGLRDRATWATVESPDGALEVSGCRALPPGAHVVRYGGEPVSIHVQAGQVSWIEAPTYEEAAPPAPPPTAPERCRPSVYVRGAEAEVTYARRAVSAALPGDHLISVNGVGVAEDEVGETFVGARDTLVTLVFERDGRRFTERLPRDRCPR